MDNRIEKTIKVITVYDTAINFDKATIIDPVTKKSPLNEYIATRDFSKIEPYLITGELPTIFHVARLTREMVRRISRIDVNDYTRAEFAFQYGLVRVENHVDDEGKTYPEWKPNGLQSFAGRTETVVSDEEMNVFSVAQVTEIGSVIYQISFLERKMQGRLQLVPTSRALLAAMMGQ